MKTLTESIIGRKGIENQILNNRTRLRQGDIVYFKKSNLGPYLVILDKKLYERICQGRLTSKDDTEKDGFLVQSQYRYGHYMIPLSGYDKDLRYKLNSEYDITMVLRGNEISSDDIGDVWDFIDEYHLSNLADKFKAVFKDGKWTNHLK